MENQELTNVRVAVLALDGVEEAELTQPVEVLKTAGAAVDIIAQTAGTIQAFVHHRPSIKLPVDKIFDHVSPDDYDALLLPGGALNADALRVVPQAQAFVTAFDHADKPMAVICHAPWLLVSADVLKGRTLTSFHTIHDDIENAGGTWLNISLGLDGSPVQQIITDPARGTHDAYAVTKDGVYYLKD